MYKLYSHNLKFPVTLLGDVWYAIGSFVWGSEWSRILSPPPSPAQLWISQIINIDSLYDHHHWGGLGGRGGPRGEGWGGGLLLLQANQWKSWSILIDIWACAAKTNCCQDFSGASLDNLASELSNFLDVFFHYVVVWQILTILWNRNNECTALWIIAERISKKQG